MPIPEKHDDEPREPMVRLEDRFDEESSRVVEPVMEEGRAEDPGTPRRKAEAVGNTAPKLFKTQMGARMKKGLISKLDECSGRGSGAAECAEKSSDEEHHHQDD